MMQKKILPKPLVTPFLSKTYDILQSNEYSDLISWCSDGHGFIVKNISKFENVVLPRYFKHNKFSSFIRQLNMYDFLKIRHKGDQKEFRHIFFAKDQPELLSQIKRKTAEVQEANDKQLRETISMAGKWRKLEKEIDMVSGSDQGIEDDFECEADLENSEQNELELFKEKRCQDLMMCLMLFNKAVKKEKTSRGHATTKNVMKLTEDYIEAMREVIRDGNNGNSHVSTQASEDECTLGKRDIDQIYIKQEQNWSLEKATKKLKSDLSFTMQVEQKDETIDPKIENEELNETHINQINHQDMFDYDENDDLYQLNHYDDFNMGLDDIFANNTTFVNMF